MGNRKLKEITALDVQALVYRKRDNGQPAAAMRIRMVLKQVFDYAIELQLVPMNPASMVATRYIGKATKRNRNLSTKEIREYLQVIYRSNIRRQFKLSLHLLLLTLVRKSMLLMAKWPEVNFETGEWLIPKENMKGRREEGRDHIVYMSAQVQTLFRELQELATGSDFVLPGRGSTMRPFAKNALNKALEGLTFNMEHVTIHDLSAQHRRNSASMAGVKTSWKRLSVTKREASQASTTARSMQPSAKRCCNGGPIMSNRSLPNRS